MTVKGSRRFSSKFEVGKSHLYKRQYEESIYKRNPILSECAVDENGFFRYSEPGKQGNAA
jgi:hypothetical protein